MRPSDSLSNSFSPATGRAPRLSIGDRLASPAAAQARDDLAEGARRIILNVFGAGRLARTAST